MLILGQGPHGSLRSKWDCADKSTSSCRSGGFCRCKGLTGVSEQTEPTLPNVSCSYSSSTSSSSPPTLCLPLLPTLPLILLPPPLRLSSPPVPFHNSTAMVSYTICRNYLPFSTRKTSSQHVYRNPNLNQPK